jgi:hypothetical protein
MVVCAPPPIGILWHCLAYPPGIMCHRCSVWIASVTLMANGHGDRETVGDREQPLADKPPAGSRRFLGCLLNHLRHHGELHRLISLLGNDLQCALELSDFSRRKV